ncbi:MAG: hypothetical protein WDM89_19685 [Rhizomicrobium sp.]
MSDLEQQKREAAKQKDKDKQKIESFRSGGCERQDRQESEIEGTGG